MAKPEALVNELAQQVVEYRAILWDREYSTAPYSATQRALEHALALINDLAALHREYEKSQEARALFRSRPYTAENAIKEAKSELNTRARKK